MGSMRSSDPGRIYRPKRGNGAIPVPSRLLQRDRAHLPCVLIIPQASASAAVPCGCRRWSSRTDQPWLDGMYAENLRSMVHRFTFNHVARRRATLSLLSRRGIRPQHPFGPRRHGQPPASVGMGQAVADVVSDHAATCPNPAAWWSRPCGIPTGYAERYSIGNDGTGFTMIQWGKLFLRAG